MEGPGIQGLRAAANAASDAGAELIYSGGVGSLDHLRELVGLGLDSLAGVIVGRALYEGRFTVTEGQAALGE
jgi:phosphoribosylformimino-5-aminoimidazole carboxamide ribotide isomerase